MPKHPALGDCTLVDGCAHTITFDYIGAHTNVETLIVAFALINWIILNRVDCQDFDTI